MKTIPVLFLMGGLMAAGCGRQEAEAPAQPAPKPSASGNPLTAPVDYLGAVAQAKKASEKTIDTVALKQAVQLFYAQEGRFPKDLNELVAQRYLGQLPAAPAGMKIVYDAAKGEVKIVNQ